MAKKYSRQRLHRAVAASCLAILASSLVLPAPQVSAADVVVDGETVANITLGMDDSLSVINGGTVSDDAIGVTVPEDIDAISITVDNTSVIEGSTFAGILMVDSASLTGGINNSGTISGGGTGIRLDNSSSISGGITNTGAITGEDHAGIAIHAGSSLINVGISNENGGAITGGEIGIEIYDNAEVASITNHGSIAGGSNLDNAGIAILGDTPTGPDGTLSAINGSSITGAVTNTGTIQGYHGIRVQYESVISGGIVNSGTISGTGVDTEDAPNESAGILVAGGEDDNNGNPFGSSNLLGGITNSAGGIISGDLAGIAILHGSTVAGVEGVEGGPDGPAIDNSGVITGGQTGIKVDTNSSIIGGIDNSGTIAGSSYAIKIYSAAEPIIINNTGTLQGDVEIDAGTLNINGGSVTGTVNGANGSTVNVNADFTTASTFGVSNLNIAENATLELRHNLFGAPTGDAIVAVENAGVLSLDRINTLNINGSYRQTASGVLRLGVESASSDYGQLNVTGAADLAASSAIDVNVESPAMIGNGDVLANVLTADTIVTGEDGLAAPTDNSSFWNFAATENGNAIDLTAERDFLLASAVARTGGSAMVGAGAAGALDAIINSGDSTGDMRDVINELDTIARGSETAAANAVAQMAPGFAGGVGQLSIGLVYHGASQVVHDRIAGLSSGQAPAKDRKVWGRPFYSSTSQHMRDGIEGYDAKNYGLALGLDTKISPAWRFGGAFSVATAGVASESAVTQQNLDVTTCQATVYATDKLLPDLSLNLMAAIGVNAYDTTRRIAFGSLNRIATANFDGEHAYLDGEVEQSYKIDDKTSLAASLRTQYAYIKIDGYTETGADALSLMVNGSSADSLVMTINGKAANTINDLVTIGGYLGLGYDFAADQASAVSTFTDGGPSFVTTGIEPSPFVMRGGGAFEVIAADGIKANARYDLDGRPDYLNQILSLNLRMPF